MATKETLLASLKAMRIGEVSEKDATLEIYLKMAGEAILNRRFPFGYEKEELVPERYELLQCEIANYLLNRRGAEGQSAHSELGISRSYSDQHIPNSMINRVVPLIGVP